MAIFDNGWWYLGIIGILFALVYRIPQITKLIRTKKSDNVSKKSFILQSCAYFFLLSYTILATWDPILVGYYIIGTLQNITVVYYILKYETNEGLSEI